MTATSTYLKEFCYAHRMRPLIVLASTALISAHAHPVLAQDSARMVVAKAGANLAGFNYQNAEYCGARAADLQAYKERARTHFKVAGDQFETHFAAGIADSIAKRNRGIADLGEEKFKASICPGVLEDLRAKLAKP